MRPSGPILVLRTLGPRDKDDGFSWGALERLLRQFHWHLDNSSQPMKPIDLRMAEELGVRAQQVAAAISLSGLAQRAPESRSRVQRVMAVPGADRFLQ